MILACVDSNVLAGNRVSHAFIISRRIAVLLCHYLSLGTACQRYSQAQFSAYYTSYSRHNLVDYDAFPLPLYST